VDNVHMVSSSVDQHYSVPQQVVGMGSNLVVVCGNIIWWWHVGIYPLGGGLVVDMLNPGTGPSAVVADDL